MLRIALIGFGVLVAVVVVAVVGATATGYLVVGDPGSALGQALTGDFDRPNVSVEETTVGPVGVPKGGISDVDSEGATVRNRIRIENPNHLGGKVRVVEYDVYLSGDRDGSYEYLGTGTVRGIDVPPNGTVTETNEFNVTHENLVTAAGRSGLSGLVSGGTWYARVEGNATVALGPASFDVGFESVREVS
ncbi:MAG: hypothetical protein ACI9QA_000033 [Methanobacteriota archaeon]|jgi:hypothetical protein